jgi:hypothetical protein
MSSEWRIHRSKSREINLDGLQHVKRMDEQRVPKRLLEMMMTGKRPRGRP